MTERLDSEDLIGVSLEALRQSDETELIERAEVEPELGEIVRLPGLEEWEADWALIFRDPANSQRFLALPSDGFTLVGTGDVRVVAREEDIARVVRCRYGGWVDVENLHSAPVVGRLSAGDLVLIRERWLALAEERRAGTILERDDEETADYQELVRDQLEPVQREVFGMSSKESGKREVRAAAKVSRFPSTLSNRRLALVASVLLAVGAGFGGLQVLKQKKELAAAQDAAFAVNPVIAYVEAAASTRSDPDPLRVLLAPENSHLLLRLPVGDPNRNRRYRLTVLPPDSDSPLWSNERLFPNQRENLLVGLPRSVLNNPGFYRLRLEKWKDGGFELHTVTDMEVVIADDS